MRTLVAEISWILSGDLRLGASFHLSDGNISKVYIKRSPYPLLKVKDLTDNIFYGGRSKRIYVTDKNKGIPFISGSDMLKSNLLCVKYVSKKYTLDLNNSLLKKNWILISRSGTVGNTMYTNADFENKAASEHIIRIIPNTKVKSGFLYAYLSSKIGYSLLTQGVFGAVVQQIETKQIENITVPIFPIEKQDEIHMLITESANLREEGNRLLKDAEQRFISELNFEQTDEQLFARSEKMAAGNIFSQNISAFSTLSLRARNYSPRKQEIIKLLTSKKYNRLIDVLKCPPFYGSRFKRIEAINGSTELLSQGDIFDYKPKGRLISKKNIHNIENEFVNKGCILIPAQGTLGENEIFARAKFVWGYLENKLVAGHAMRFIPNNKTITEGYLFMVLSSKMWFRLLRNSVYGTNLLGFIIPFLNEYPIPRFDNGIEQIIDEIVKSAYNKLTISIDKENKAIQLVEKEIEQWQQ